MPMRADEREAWQSLAGMVAAFALGVCMAAMVLSACGCARPEWGNAVTPRYGIRVMSEVPVDLDAVDEAWGAVVACWQRQGVTVTMRPPGVGIRSHVTRRGACETFEALVCDGNGKCGPAEVWGIYYPAEDIVHVGPSLCSLQHEFAHVAELRLTKATGPVYAKCDGGGGW